MRSLAQRSASAAKEIKSLIDASVSNVEATREQTLGIEQSDEAVSQMDRTTQQNASLAEEAAAASETLQRQAAAPQLALPVD